MAVFASGVAYSQSGDLPALAGPVTQFTSLSDFAVSRKMMNMRPDTQYRLLWPDGSSVILKQPFKLFIGEHVAIFASDRGEGAGRVDIQQPAMHSVGGDGIVEAVLPGTDLEVRADGYRIRIDSKTNLKYEKPLSTANDVKVNAAVQYEGTLQKDGTELATVATFSEHKIFGKNVGCPKSVGLRH